jgi:hypothetical protein
MSLIDEQMLKDYMPPIDGCVYLPYHPSHLDNFTGIYSYGSEQMSDQDRKRYINYQSQCGPAVSVFIDNHIVCMFGMVNIWTGVGEAWALFTEEARKYPIAMTKGAIAFFDIVTILFRLHRLQITVKKKDTRAVRWAKALYFVEEGLMKAYSADKEDTYMMRRF